MPKPTPAVRELRISDARDLGKLLRAEGIVIIAIKPGANPSQFAMASWGETRVECDALWHVEIKKLGRFIDGTLLDCMEFQGPDI